MNTARATYHVAVFLQGEYTVVDIGFGTIIGTSYSTYLVLKSPNGFFYNDPLFWRYFDLKFYTHLVPSIHIWFLLNTSSTFYTHLVPFIHI